MSETTKTDEVHVPFEQTVWDTLSRIDVNDHVDHLPKTKKRPAVAYLPWHKAWTLAVRKFPASTYSHRADITHSDGTMEVEVDLVISNGSSERFMNARLPVMDSWFNAIPNPNARDINDARQRCLVKALAFCGLGLNLWAGDIIPVGRLSDPITPTQYDELKELIEETETDEQRFLDWCEVENLEDLPFERFGSAARLLHAKLARKKQAEKEVADEDS
jgi:hypothetical protein